MPSTASTPGRDVLAATDYEVILRGQQFADTTDEPIDCVVYVSRALYYAAVSEWLDQKAEYFKHYREFVAVGSILFEQLTLRPGRVELRTEDGISKFWLTTLPRLQSTWSMADGAAARRLLGCET